jgi:hypothetical protein
MKILLFFFSNTLSKIYIKVIYSIYQSVKYDQQNYTLCIS